MKLLLIFIITGNLLLGASPDTAASAPVFIDSLSITDSLDVQVTPHIDAGDTLVQIHLSSLITNDLNFSVNINEFYRNDYRYTADILRISPFTFIRDIGSGGKPENLTLYGAGYSNIGIIDDGIMLNQRLNNSFNLHFVNTERIDSLEIVSPTRGFLYGTGNNLAAVNIISKDFLSRAPYSRLKFYEAPFGEALFDGTFNAYVYKNVNLYFNFNNRIYGQRYINDEYTNWNAKVQVKYFASPVINLIASYSSHFSETQLNGGVDFDSLQKSVTAIDDILYDRILAPVHQSDRYEKVNLHNFDLTILHKFSDSFYGGISFYSKYHLNQFRNDFNEPIIFNNKEEIKTAGAIVRQHFKKGIFHFQAEGIFEKIDYIIQPSYILPELNMSDKFTFSGSGSNTSFSANASYSLFNDRFVHSVFYKYSFLLDKIHRNGIGTDLQISIGNNFKVYFGSSAYETREQKLRIVTEVKGIFENDFLSTGINYFYYTNSINHFFAGEQTYSHLSFQQQLPLSFSMPVFVDIAGAGGNINLRIWKFSVEARASYYYDVKAKSTYSRLPVYTASGGIYFKSILFNDNLDLKTGFNFNAGGEQKYFYIKQHKWIDVPAYITIDFFAAAEIQKTAFIYFVFENLLNKDYYITPFYPMHERGIRFGAAWEFLN